MSGHSSIKTTTNTGTLNTANHPLDLIIIGAGPIGISCAIQAKKKGLSYLVLEKGCMTNSLYNYPLDMQFFSSSEKLELEDIPFNSIEAKPRRKEALEYYRRIADHFELNIKLFEAVLDIQSKSQNTAKKTLELDRQKEASLFQINSSKGRYFTKNVTIATGFFDLAANLKVPGEELPKVSHYFKEAHYYSGQKLAVIGASNSAIDAALACYRKGAHVSLIIRGAAVGPRVKYWVRPDIMNRIEEGSITAYYNASVTEIGANSLSFTQDNVTKTIENDFVLALTGYRPNLPFLTQLGITLEGTPKIPSHHPKTMETNVPGVYLAGVICGGLETHKWFIENSRAHGNLIAEHILSKA
ncbi:YpdA family putative bacillithiol disulfide reductase [Flavobacteriaceae bacterium]|nr:YpdA family putative bacillithiol disulfide reductase [Flavobacteriaceae bacterium]